MNKPLNFHLSRNNLLFTSDLHLQHNPDWKSADPLWKSRGFNSIAEHDEWIKAEWLRLVTPETIVFNLGDSTFTDPKGAKFHELSIYPGRQYLINGNHWSGQKQVYRGAPELVGLKDYQYVYPLTINNITFLGDSFLSFIEGISVYMQHYASFIWPETKAGGFALCGHSHGRCAELNPDFTTFGKILDVGVDNAKKYNGTPFFTWNEIQSIMANKPIRTSDHH